MRVPTTATVFLFVLWIVGAAATQAAAAHAAASYCPSPDHDEPAKAPADLAPALAKTFGVEIAAVREASFVRCAGVKLLGCYVGANLDCGKADTRRTLPGATAWCRQNPGSANVPMAATGHATIYQWSCKGRGAIVVKATVAVDPQGYIADNWKEVR